MFNIKNVNKKQTNKNACTVCASFYCLNWNLQIILSAVHD